MAFVIDSSGSVGRKNWERMKRFVKVFVSKFDVGSSTAHVAAIAYSSYPEIILQFRNYQGTDEVNRRLDRMRWQRGYTYTDKALGLADSQLFQTSTGMRQGVGKVRLTCTGNLFSFFFFCQGLGWGAFVFELIRLCYGVVSLDKKLRSIESLFSEVYRWVPTTYR